MDGSAAERDEDAYAAALAEAATRRRAGDVAGALIAVDRALDARPRDPRALHEKTGFLIALGRLDDAEAHVARWAANAGPRPPALLFVSRADARRAGGDAVGAAQALEAGRAAYPDNLPLLRFCARRWAEAGAVRRASALFDALEARAPGDLEALRTPLRLARSALGAGGGGRSSGDGGVGDADAAGRDRGDGVRRAARRAWAAATEPGRPTAALRLEIARALAAIGDLAPALEAFAAAAAADPETAGAAEAEMARLERRLGHVATARRRLDAAILARPKDRAAHLERLTLLKTVGPAEAIAPALDAFAAMAPDAPEPHLERAALIRRSVGEGAALAALERGLDAVGDDPRLVRAAARSRRLLGDPIGAIALLRPHLAAQPNDHVGREELIAALIAADRLPAAAAECDALAERLGATAPATLTQRSVVAAASGALDDAIAWIDRALARRPSDPALLVERLRLLARAGRRAALAAEIERLKAGAPPAAALLEIGRIEREAERWRRAAETFDRARRAAPADVAPYAALAGALVAVGAAEAAIDVLSACPPPALARGATLTAALATAEWAAGRFERSLARLRDGVAEAPTDAALRRTLARQLVQWGAFEEAEALIDAGVDAGSAERRAAAALQGDLAAERFAPAAALAAYEAAADGDPAAWAFARGQALLALFEPDAARRALSAAGERRVALGWEGATAASGASGVPPIDDPLRELGAIAEEYRLDPDLCAALAAAAHAPFPEGATRMASAAEAAPDKTAPAIGLLAALRRAGRLRIATLAEGDKAGEEAGEEAGAEAGSRAAWDACGGVSAGASSGAGGADPARRAIPRRLLQFWDAEAPPPAEIDSRVRAWAAAHPAWRHRLYDRAAAERVLSEPGLEDARRAFRRSDSPAVRADLFRLAALWSQGGVWVDAEDMCAGRLERILPFQARFAAVQGPLGALGVRLLAAAPGHPTIADALARATAAALADDAEARWLATGPGLLTRAFVATAVDFDALALRPDSAILTEAQARRATATRRARPEAAALAAWAATLRRV